MNKFIALLVLVLLAGVGFAAGKYFSADNKESSSERSSFREMSAQDIQVEGVDMPEEDPDIRGRVVSVAKDHMVISRSSVQNERTEEGRENRREQMQNMSDEERQAMRAERQSEREENSEQVRVNFSQDVKIVLSMQEGAEVVAYDKIDKDMNVSIWTVENSSDTAQIVLVRQFSN